MAGNEHYVLFSGANERAVIACCRYFAQNNVSFSIIARPAGDKILLTTYKKNVECYRALDQLDVEDMLTQVERLKNTFPEKRLVFLPTSESVNRIVLEHRAKFESMGLIVPLCEEALYITLSDKSSFNALAQYNGIELPERIDSPSNSHLPIVAKPISELSASCGKKLYPQLLFSQDHLSAFCHDYSADDFFFQRYVDGQSYYLLLFIDRHNVKVLWQKNVLQQAEGKSIIAAHICQCPDEQFEYRAINMLQSVGFTGFIMIEMMRENEGSYLIEANPRLWGPFQLAIHNGFNPEWASLSGNYAETATKTPYYFWLNGFLINQAEGKRARHFTRTQSYFSYVTRGEIYRHRDTCRLFIHECSQALRKFFKRKDHECRRENVPARTD